MPNGMAKRFFTIVINKSQFVGLSRSFLIDISKKIESHTVIQNVYFSALKKFFEFFMRKNLLYRFLCFCADFVLNG